MHEKRAPKKVIFLLYIENYTNHIEKKKTERERSYYSTSPMNKTEKKN